MEYATLDFGLTGDLSLLSFSYFFLVNAILCLSHGLYFGSTQHIWFDRFIAGEELPQDESYLESHTSHLDDI